MQNVKTFRTKALVLELLAAICLVKGGHEIILSAFDNFKEVCTEGRRFSTLMGYFTQYDNFHIEFMVACMQFVNIVVHSVEDMNFRVHLQYEFTKLGLDEYLDKLRHTESEDLQVCIPSTSTISAKQKFHRKVNLKTLENYVSGTNLRLFGQRLRRCGFDGRQRNQDRCFGKSGRVGRRVGTRMWKTLPSKLRNIVLNKAKNSRPTIGWQNSSENP